MKKKVSLFFNFQRCVLRIIQNSISAFKIILSIISDSNLIEKSPYSFAANTRVTRIIINDPVKVFILVFLYSVSSFAQNPVYKKYTIDEGLPSNLIYQITQDSKGYIWLATSKGASRFDGSRFENFSIENGLPDNEVLMIIEDKRGRIWFKSFNGAMAYFDGTVHNSSNTPWLKQLEFNVFVRVFTPLYNGDVLIHTNEKKIYVLKDTILQMYKTELCRDIFEKKDSSILIIQPNNFIDNGKNIDASIFNIGLHDQYVNYYNNVEDVLLTVTEDGMYCYKNNKISYLANQNAISNKNRGCVIISDREGYFWNTDNTNLFRFKIDENASLKEVHKYFEGFSINNIFQDRDNNFWFATKGEGLLMTPSLSIKLFNKASGLQDNNITTAIRMNDGKIFCGTLNGFIHTIDSTNTIEKTENTNYGEIRKVIKDEKNGAYFLTKKNIFHKKGKEVKNCCITLTTYKTLARCGNDEIITGGYSNMLKLKNNKSEYTKISNNQYRFYAICEKSKNEFWIGTEKGLLICKNDVLKPFHHELKSLTGWIDDISKTKDATMLVTTRDNGLAIFKNDNIEFINTSMGLQSNVCTSLYYDTIAEKVFLGLNNGLSIISFNNNKVKEIKNYNASTGLLCGSIFSVAENNGEILLGTDRGLLIFDERDMNSKVETPKVHITNFEINNAPAEIKRKYELNYTQNNIRIIYGGISFRDPKSLEYRYKLTPSDTGWNITKSKSIVYPNLMPGNYNFSVQVRIIGHSQWIIDKSQLKFVISKPYWSTWWFRLLELGFSISLIYLLYRYQLNKKLQQQLAISADRARISSEMHDDLGSGLSKISLLSDMINQNASGEDIKPHLENISRSSKEVVKAMGDIIWSMNNKHDQIANLMAYTRKYAMEFFETTTIQCKVILPDVFPVISINGIARRNIFLVVKEALHNVLKHSEANQVTIKFNTTANNLMIQIKDNGKGIDTAKISLFSNGLINMEKRIKDCGGTFYIKSEEGTTIEITIPLET